MGAQVLEPKQEVHQFVDVTVKMRLAKGRDFNVVEHTVGENGRLVKEVKPKLGQPYWVKGSDGNFDNKNYEISEDTNWTEFKEWIRQDMVYVPASIFELKDAQS